MKPSASYLPSSTDAVQRYTIFDRKECVANINNERTPCSVQRHTFSSRKPCIASTEREEKADAVQRHTFFDRKECVANERTPCSVQRHTFSSRKTCIASTEREEKADAMQRHTLKMQFACINYDIQKNLCTFQIFLTCIFSSHFCFSLKVIPRQALPSAKKHEKIL